MNKSQFGFKTGTTCDAHYENSTFSRIPCSSNLFNDSSYFVRIAYGTGRAFLNIDFEPFTCNCTCRPSSFPTTVLSNKFMYF